ncbi:MAG: hypothetical protein ACREPP_07685, partial [Rhodanobacteraceae bacterium]
MKRAPTTFVLVLILVALALLLALGLSTALSIRLVRKITVETNAQMAAAITLAVDVLAEREDAGTRQAIAGLRGVDVEVRRGPPPRPDADVPAALLDTGEEIGRLLGDPSRVVLTRTPDGQIWIHSTRDPERWIVIHTLAYRQQVINSTLLLTGLAGVIALIFAAWVAHLLTGPLSRLAARAPSLLAGDFSVAQLRGSPREVRQLAQSIGAAGERLREASQERELMLAGVSHDL